MELLRDVRNTFYKVPKPDVQQLVITDVDVDELDSKLRKVYYEEAEEYTYKYDGEILNLRRPAGVEDGYQMVVHVRGFPHPDGIEVQVHYEISRFNHPREHLDGTIFKWDEGQRQFEQDLDSAGLDYKELGQS